MNLPNTITIGRLFVTLAVFVLLVMLDAEAPNHAVAWWAFGGFLLAAGTDFLDGYLARKLNQVTAFGRVADPFADKILITGILVLLLRFPRATEGWLLADWIVVLILGREFLVTSIRGMVESSGVPFPADRLGKWKMIAQATTCAALLTLVAGAEWTREIAIAGVWTSLVLTLWSGVGYVFKARTALAAAAAGSGDTDG